MDNFVMHSDGRKFVVGSDEEEYLVTGYPGQVKSGYMCAVDFQYEVGEASSTGPIFSSLENLRANKSCISGCGWVRVLVIGVEFDR